MNRAKKSYRSMPLSFPTIFLMGFLLLLAFSIPVSAENPNAAQWESVGGEMILSGDHKFTTSWTSDGSSRSKGLYWQGSFYLPHKERKYTPWENTVKNSVAPKKGQITVQGPGNVGLFQRSKYAGIAMRNTETGSGFTFWRHTLGWQVGKGWEESVKDYNPKGEFWGYIPADQVVTLDVEAHMSSYDNSMGTSEYAFRAPQEVEYEVWFFPREGGEVINVTKYGPGVPKGKIYGTINPPLEVPWKSQAGTLTGQQTEVSASGSLPKPTLKEEIHINLAKIDSALKNPNLSDKNKKTLQWSRVQLTNELRNIRFREEFARRFWENVKTPFDKLMGYFPGTSTVWGIGTGVIQAGRGYWKDAFNRFMGAIPGYNFGTVWSGLNDFAQIVEKHEVGSDPQIKGPWVGAPLGAPALPGGAYFHP